MIPNEGKDDIIYEIGDIVKIINDTPLSGNDIAPPVVIGDEHEVLNITLDKRGYQHLDLGFPSMYNYIRSWETGEDLINGDKTHWVHPSRVKFIK